MKKAGAIPATSNPPLATHDHRSTCHCAHRGAVLKCSRLIIKQPTILCRLLSMMPVGFSVHKCTRVRGLGLVSDALMPPAQWVDGREKQQSEETRASACAVPARPRWKDAWEDLWKKGLRRRAGEAHSVLSRPPVSSSPWHECEWTSVRGWCWWVMAGMWRLGLCTAPTAHRDWSSVSLPVSAAR